MRRFHDESEALRWAAVGGQALLLAQAGEPVSLVPGLPSLRPGDRFALLYDWNLARLHRTAKTLAVQFPYVRNRFSPLQCIPLVRFALMRAMTLSHDRPVNVTGNVPLDAWNRLQEFGSLAHYWTRYHRKAPRKVAHKIFAWSCGETCESGIQPALFDQMSSVAHKVGGCRYSHHETVELRFPLVRAAESCLAVALWEMHEDGVNCPYLGDLAQPSYEDFRGLDQFGFCDRAERAFPQASEADLDLAVRSAFT